ncbi:MAG: glycogen synthase [Dehalococcoidia bacterium]|nr:glycogen synthase [Dehalococcoidia bacterium]MDD5493384.1 glycogen synthase [Dehalococcoidia bacterium]
MKILFAAAEIAPLSKVGGLADVMRSLPQELIKAGHDVRAIIPKYGFIDFSNFKTERIVNDFTVLALGKYRKIHIEQIIVEDVETFLVCDDIFTDSALVYGENELEKFFVFCTAVSDILPHLGWQPDIIHCHDWHAALIPLMVRNKAYNYKTVFTIHNIKYQGNFDHYFLHETGLAAHWHARLPMNQQVPLTFMSQGILWADVVSTVSETFAREILTYENGCGLQDLLNFRKGSLYGIRNGLGYEEYDPEADKLITANYSFREMDGKSVNKRKLQQLSGWRENMDVPLIGMVTRMDEQKGLDIILQALPGFISKVPVQFVFLGKGKDYYENAMEALGKRYPDNVKTYITFDNPMAHLIYAGSDIFLMPSNWEPCGLSQLIAMRYGSVPLVRATGGLVDTVRNLSSDLGKGTGFVFEDYTAQALTSTLKRAAQDFNNKGSWDKAVRRIMKQDFTWRDPVARYETLYKKLLELSGNAA